MGRGLSTFTDADGRYHDPTDRGEERNWCLSSPMDAGTYGTTLMKFDLLKRRTKKLLGRD